MLLHRDHRRILAALIGLWVIAASYAHAQFDAHTGSQLDPQPWEVLPPASGQPLDAQCPPNWTIAPPPPDFTYHVGGKGRGYYINDHRIEFTGQEATFVAEGVFDGGIMQHTESWDVSVETQLFLNQPFGKNIYVNTPERRSFAANFDIEQLEISQLYVGARHDDFYAALGKFVTPFGRFYFPNYRNNFDDSPFIRSEAILFRETGLLVQYDPGMWVCTAALTNGSFQQDTNSSKAIVARVGIDQPNYAFGGSIKYQDGIGSESQKIFNNHAGLDAMVRLGSWTLSGEAIYDEYGLRRPGTPLNDITWGRSLYYRDLNNGYHVPITGVGYYLNLGYEGPQWSLMLNYGEFHPQPIGNLRHDTATRRGLIKASRHWTRHFETYGIAMMENDLADSFDSSTRRGTYVIIGGQFAF